MVWKPVAVSALGLALAACGGGQAPGDSTFPRGAIAERSCRALEAVVAPLADLDRLADLMDAGKSDEVRALARTTTAAFAGIYDPLIASPMPASTSRREALFAVEVMTSVSSLEGMVGPLADDPVFGADISFRDFVSMMQGLIGIAQRFALGLDGEPALCPGLVIASPFPAFTYPPAADYPRPPGDVDTWAANAVSAAGFSLAAGVSAVAAADRAPWLPENLGGTVLPVPRVTNAGPSAAYASDAVVYRWDGIIWVSVTSCSWEEAGGEPCAEGGSDPMPTPGASPPHIANIYLLHPSSVITPGVYALVVPIWREAHVAARPAEAVACIVEVGSGQ